MTKYFVSYVCNGIFGNTMLASNVKLNTTKAIIDTMLNIQKELDTKYNVLIISIIELDGEK